MSKLSATTTSISIIVAVVLWALATWLEGEKSQADFRSVDAARAFSDEVATDTEIRTDGLLHSCWAAEAEVLKRVEESQSCEVDEDCTIFDYGYPIQCLTSVASSEITALRLEYRKYEQSCEYRVYYDCPSAPLQRRPVCQNNRCAVELQTLDILKDATLDHIGVDEGVTLKPLPARRPRS